MKVPFMSDYAKRLVQVCHRHGAHAMGGMSAFIPSRRDEQVNKIAIEQVSKDKEIEVCIVIFMPPKYCYYSIYNKYNVSCLIRENV